MAYRFKPKGIRRRKFGRKLLRQGNMADFAKGFDQLWKYVWPQFLRNFRDTWSKLFPETIPSTRRSLPHHRSIRLQVPRYPARTVD